MLVLRRLLQWNCFSETCAWKSHALEAMCLNACMHLWCQQQHPWQTFCHLCVTVFCSAITKYAQTPEKVAIDMMAGGCRHYVTRLMAVCIRFAQQSACHTIEKEDHFAWCLWFSRFIANLSGIFDATCMLTRGCNMMWKQVSHYVQAESRACFFAKFNRWSPYTPNMLILKLMSSNSSRILEAWLGVYTIWVGLAALTDDAIEFIAKLQHSMSLHPCSNEQWLWLETCVASL